jgi:hypothetical protein
MHPITIQTHSVLSPRHDVPPISYRCPTHKTFLEKEHSRACVPSVHCYRASPPSPSPKRSHSLLLRSSSILRAAHPGRVLKGVFYNATKPTFRPRKCGSIPCPPGRPWTGSAGRNDNNNATEYTELHPSPPDKQANVVPFPVRSVTYPAARTAQETFISHQAINI